MRRSITTTVVLAVTLIATGVAWAAFTQVAGVSLTAHRAGQSTGITSDLHSSDPTAPGQKPKAASKVVITFPTGTAFNLTTPLVARCTRSDAQLKNQFGRPCPAKSRIGTGTAIANAAPLVPTVSSRVTAFVGGARTIILVVKPTLPAFAAQIVVLRATVSGPRLTIPVPTVVLPTAPGSPGIRVVLVSLKLRVPALGTGHTALITAGRCTAHQFVVRSRFTYADHSTLTLSSASACR